MEDPSADEVERVLALVEEAKEALVAAVPSPRGVARVPLASALLNFETRLREAEPIAARSDVPGAAIAEALRRAERLRLEAPELDYEGLVDVLARLMEPLDALDDGSPDQSTRRR